ncbi:exopolysaccharide biosynthesis polyprenyl glycosylphosphotransferase [Caldicellulosiruptor acetigenus I77R1B]|uniref:Exopolysaccharide biosynthesis polyprenyl glycosylphosphotransferase n=1 Tax=Caldicellulosiruptor acetigenus (strain ATCC 700853 / DSM 12137 / I77R1B) TaxID=632335 RepID=E4S7Y2_CALA7|nr:exopolysaccharide biosynthesis polyprenyl glycosylphosphotransferase [Caldicellulosiruptor acetigenus]ADQ41882.1 exopolysaccharide biosynthesis polyprenyl glycosylphosphotransferase [Caldicellulosiruptor acetigenus I77R1B]
METKQKRKIIFNLFDMISLTAAYWISLNTLYKYNTSVTFSNYTYQWLGLLILLFWTILAAELTRLLREDKTIKQIDLLKNSLVRGILIAIFVICVDWLIMLNINKVFVVVFLGIYILFSVIQSKLFLFLDKFTFLKFQKKFIIVMGTENCIEEGTKYLKENYPHYALTEKLLLDSNNEDYIIDVLKHSIQNRVVDMVCILKDENISDKVIEQIIKVCKESGREVNIYYKNNFNMEKANVKVDNGYIVLNFKPVEIPISYVITKRILDIILSSIALLLTMPLFLIIAIAIKLESPKGPVFFVQERVGLNGRRFKLIKFRTMIPDAEKYKEKLMAMNEMDGPVFKITNDPRITKVGSILRKLSLDELPQLINVLKGEMSLVGPRPLPTNEAIKCEVVHQIRHIVKPGITCIWQATKRNNCSFREWMKLDKEYILRRNLMFDFYLILKTVLAVIKMTGK